MARVLGFETRVVVGFVPSYRADGTFVATGKDVHAWAEVRFAGVGWVTFDPTPTVSVAAGTRLPAPSSAAPPSQPASQPSASASPPATRPTHAPRRGHGAGSDSSAALPITVGGLAGMVVLLAIPPVAKAVRRTRRRRASTPGRAVVGAWRETLDRLTEAGVRAGPDRTSHEVAGVAPPGVRADVATLATLLDRAGYAPEPPGPGAAHAAWAHTSGVAATLARDRTPLRRLLVALDPRPLWRR